MTIKITIEGNTIKELGHSLEELAGHFSATGTVRITDVVSMKGTHEPIQPAPSKDLDPKVSKGTATTQEPTSKATTAAASTGLIADEVLYSGKSTKRNAWLLLTDGRVIFVKAGSHMPDESAIEKRITKTIFDQEVENGTVVVTNIADCEEDEVKHVKEDKKKKAAPVEDEDDEDDEDETDEDETDEEDEFDEDEDDEDETYTVDEVKKLVLAAKAIEGGKKVVKELLAEYEVKTVAKLDEDDLQDVADELAEFIEENE